MVFQDPLSALTPVFTIGEQIAEALLIHNPDMPKDKVRERCIELLEIVGITDPESRLDSYPHEFSGGMRQRVVIAIAIANNPDVIIADEPTTALDVTIQAQILDVLAVAQRETGAAVILITHDLGVVAGMADDVMVMYAGKAIERGSIDTLFADPAQPYTMGLLGAVPKPHKAADTRLVPIKGNPPSLAALPSGCPFSPRCPLATDVCFETEAELSVVDESVGHLAACHRLKEIVDQGLTYEDVFPELDPLPAKWADVPREARPVVLEVKDLVKTFPVQGKGFIRRQKGVVTAVDHVSFKIHQGETLALVGESGSGKSTTLMQIMELAKPESGQITVLGRDVSTLKNRRERNEVRRDLQVIFQDPMSSLDPRMPIYDVLAEPLEAQKWTKAQINDRIGDLMHLVGINPDYVDRFPTQFSGPAPAHRHCPAPSRPTPRSCCSTSPSPRSTSPSRRASSTCWKTCRRSSSSPTCSSRTTWRSSAISQTPSRSCTSARSSSTARPRMSSPTRRIPIPRRCSPPSRSPIRWSSARASAWSTRTASSSRPRRS